MNNYKLPNLEDCSVAIIGLGYVGLPLAMRISQQNICLLTKKNIIRKVIAYDINSLRINELKKGYDRNKLFSKNEFKNIGNLIFSDKKKL